MLDVIRVCDFRLSNPLEWKKKHHYCINLMTEATPSSSTSQPGNHIPAVCASGARAETYMSAVHYLIGIGLIPFHGNLSKIVNYATPRVH